MSKVWLKELLIGTSWKRIVACGFVMAIVTALVFSQILMPVRLMGSSMEPKYANGSWLLINLWTYSFREPRVGDVVAIGLAGPSVLFFKRIVGCPGDIVEWKEGRLWRNGQIVEEPYVKLPCNWDSKAVTVGKDEVFVVGDNRSTAMNDHSLGLVDDYRLVGGPLW